MNPRSVSLQLSPSEVERLSRLYKDGEVPVDDKRIAARYKSEDCSITVYAKIKNGCQTVLFQGEGAAYESSIFEDRDEDRKFVSSIGSDEVGTGDFLGPVVVVAAYVDEKQLGRLKELGVTDSKAMDDMTIRHLGPILIKEFDYSGLCCDIDKYNSYIDRGINLNSIKAHLHNKALLNVASRHPGAPLFQDQFAAPKLYYSYLKEEKEIASPITFATKGETKFPSVALASVIARYGFLLRMDELSKKYGVTFPLGAGSEVDAFAKKLIKKIGEEEFSHLAKHHFANYKKLFS